MTKKKAARNPQLTPNEFLRALRPEKFSDSIVEDELILDRSQLEFHLETLTSRNQEAAFATFAKHLAEREICPNLLPQTGPTGGGDSRWIRNLIQLLTKWLSGGASESEEKLHLSGRHLHLAPKKRGKKRPY